MQKLSQGVRRGATKWSEWCQLLKEYHPARSRHVFPRSPVSGSFENGLSVYANLDQQHVCSEKGVISCYLGIMRNPEMENVLSASHPDLKSMNLWPISCTRAFWRYELLFSGSPWTWSNRRRNSRKALQPKIDPQSRSWRKSPAKRSVSRSMSLDPTLRYLHRITTWRNCEDFLPDGVAQPTSQEHILND